MSRPRTARPEPPLPIVQAASLDEHHTADAWLVEQLWAHSGVGIVGGAPKCCKSWLGLELAVAVASSTPCLGRFKVHAPGPVLVYLAEDSPHFVKQRLRSLCHHRQLDLARIPLHVITATSLRLDLEHDQRRLDATLRNLRPRLLLLDPFVRLHRINENDAGEVSGILAFLRELQRTHSLAVVVVHHTRKNGPAGLQAGQGLRGSSDFHAWTDSALYLRRQRDQLLLTVEHRAAPAPDPLPLALLAGNGYPHLEILSHPPEAADAPPLAARILAAIDQLGGTATRDALRSALHIRNERLGPELTRLVASGALARTTAGWTRVPVPPPCQKAERNDLRTLPLF
jgi:hypothetical protein